MLMLEKYCTKNLANSQKCSWSIKMLQLRLMHFKATQLFAKSPIELLTLYLYSPPVSRICLREDPHGRVLAAVDKHYCTRPSSVKPLKLTDVTFAEPQTTSSASTTPATSSGAAHHPADHPASNYLINPTSQPTIRPTAVTELTAHHERRTSSTWRESCR